MRQGTARRSIPTLACVALLLLVIAPGRSSAATGRQRPAGSPTGGAGVSVPAAPRVAAPPRGRVAGVPPQLASSATAAMLVAPATGQVLYALHPHRELAIASETKLMTALVTLRHFRRLGVELAQNDYYPAAADSQIGLVPGERMSVHDLLIALMLPSADDAAEDLAYNVGHGSVSAFVSMMNAEARRLGLRQTHYTTPSGLDTPGNYSTAADLVRLSTFDLAQSAFLRRVVALPWAVLRSGAHPRRIVNTNDLVGRVRWIDGIKTGHTLDAGYVLVASGHRDGMTLVSAVLGTPSEGLRDAETLALQEYGFANFRLVRPVSKGAVLARLPIAGRPGMRAALVAGRGMERVLRRSTQVELRVQAPSRLRGPVPAGTHSGTATVLADGRPIGEVPLLLAEAVPAPPAPAAAALGVTPFLAALAVLLAGGWVWTLRRRDARQGIRTETEAGGLGRGARGRHGAGEPRGRESR